MLLRGSGSSSPRPISHAAVLWETAHASGSRECASAAGSSESRVTHTVSSRIEGAPDVRYTARPTRSRCPFAARHESSILSIPADSARADVTSPTIPRRFELSQRNEARFHVIERKSSFEPGVSHVVQPVHHDVYTIVRDDNLIDEVPEDGALTHTATHKLGGDGRGGLDQERVAILKNRPGHGDGGGGDVSRMDGQNGHPCNRRKCGWTRCRSPHLRGNPRPFEDTVPWRCHATSSRRFDTRPRHHWSTPFL